MVEWWEAMTLAEQIFATVGIAATILLVIQVILLAVGVGQGGDGGVDTDVDTGADVPDSPHADFQSDASVDVDVSTGYDVDAATGDIYYHADAHTVPDYMYDDASAPPSHAAEGLRMLTLQGLVAFFAVFGWSGLIMLKSGVAPPLSIALAIIFGVAAMALMAVIIRAMLRLQADGSMDIRNALGKSGTVYLPIYPNRSKAGKITVMVQESLEELSAVTDGDEKLPTGCEVTVIGISNGNTLIVRKK